MGYVFISYSRVDQTFVQALALHLRAHGVESWFDHDLVPGDAFGTSIQRAIDGCDAFLVVLTPDAVASVWVQREIVYADSKRKPLLPLLRADCQKPIELITSHHEDVRAGQMPSAAFMERLRLLVAGPLGVEHSTHRLAGPLAAHASPDPAAPSSVATGAMDHEADADGADADGVHHTRMPDDLPLAEEARRAIQILNPGGEVQMPRPPRTRVFCIANQRRGVGKTTTVVNIAAALALHHNRVLVVDLDAPGSGLNASAALDVPHDAAVPDVYDCLVAETPIADVVQPVQGIPNLWCVPATIGLAGAEIELMSMVSRESRLAKALEQHQNQYDYIFIDCPPSLGLLTVNALVASKEVMIPIQCEYYALEGVQQLTNNIQLVKNHLNPDLEITTVLLTMYDRRTRLADAVEQDVRAHFGDRVLTAVIPRTTRLSEAPSYVQSVITHDPGSRVATSYFEAALEIAVRGARVGAA